MSIIVTVLHVVACFVLIVVVLLQTGKGADIGAVFGGSSQTIFGSSGAGNLLTRLTTWTAVIFMVTSLFLTWNSTHHLTKSIADTLPDEPPPLSAPIDAGSAPAGAAAPADGSTATAPADGVAAPAGDAAPAAAAADTTAPVEAAPAQDEAAPAAGAAAPAQGDAAPAADDKSASAAGAATAPTGQEAAPAQP